MLAVAKLDRLSRSLLDFASLMDRASREGWAITALDLGVDTMTPSGEMMANVMAAFAQYERHLISQRTQDALAELRRQGQRARWTGPAADEVRHRIAAEREDGDTLQAIADRLNEDAVPTGGAGGSGGRPPCVQSWHPSRWTARWMQRVYKRTALLLSRHEAMDWGIHVGLLRKLFGGSGKPKCSGDPMDDAYRLGAYDTVRGMFGARQPDDLTRESVETYESAMKDSVDESIVYNPERAVLGKLRSRGLEPRDVSEFLDQHAPEWLTRFAEDYPQAGFSGEHLRAVRMLERARFQILTSKGAINSVSREDEPRCKVQAARRAMQQVAEAHATLDVASAMLGEDPRPNDAKRELEERMKDLEAVLDAERNAIEPHQPDLYASNE